MEHHHNMKAVSLRTGLSAHLIRIWEKRYGAVTPERTSSQRRLYSDQDVHRLKLLGKLTQQGFGISQIACLPAAQLEQMANGHSVILPEPSDVPEPSEAEEEVFIDQALTATKHYDSALMTQTLDAAMLKLGACGVLERMLIRLLCKIGERWAEGWLTAAQEHFASAAIREYLARHVRPMIPSPTAPCIVVGTPEGQLHELGAVIAASLARKCGWNVTYLGPSLPAEEIAAACVANHAKALALSIIYPCDDPLLPDQLRRLRQLLPAAVEIIVGGSCLTHYQEALESIHASVVEDLSAFSKRIVSLREELIAVPTVRRKATPATKASNAQRVSSTTNP